MSSETYKIVRHFQRGRNQVILTGLTLEEAQAHCNDPETSSSTATSSKARQLTARKGPWFDGYTEENPSPEVLAERAASDRRLREGVDAVNRLLGNR